ncbi:MAG: hypothetical protein FJW39_32410 [Acidobacteria bacterium]|nr:hypothetical protein [Acidobacteriota bacterium]
MDDKGRESILMPTKSLLLLAVAGSMATTLASDAWSKQYLNNEGLVLLARAGYGERFLAELVQTQPSRFDTSVEGLVFLAKNGVSERMVRMVLVAKKKVDEENDWDGPSQKTAHAAAPAMKPVRVRAVKQTVLVPQESVGAGGQVLLLDPRLLQAGH